LAEKCVSALFVRALAMIPAVIELRHVPLQVLLAYVVESADKATDLRQNV
jgi:hypothetical protein